MYWKVDGWYSVSFVKFVPNFSFFFYVVLTLFKILFLKNKKSI